MKKVYLHTILASLLCFFCANQVAAQAYTPTIQGTVTDGVSRYFYWSCDVLEPQNHEQWRHRSWCSIHSPNGSVFHAVVFAFVNGNWHNCITQERDNGSVSVAKAMPRTGSSEPFYAEFWHNTRDFTQNMEVRGHLHWVWFSRGTLHDAPTKGVKGSAYCSHLIEGTG